MTDMRSDEMRLSSFVVGNSSLAAEQAYRSAPKQCSISS